MSSKQKGDSGTKPELYKAVRVWLEDGSRTHGMWTGSNWWCVKSEISRVKWELKKRSKKTKKISKTLPEPPKEALS